jgi:hypothetical protein
MHKYQAHHWYQLSITDPISQAQMLIEWSDPEICHGKCR